MDSVTGPVEGARPFADHVEASDDIPSSGLIVAGRGTVVMGSPIHFDRAG